MSNVTNHWHLRICTTVLCECAWTVINIHVFFVPKILTIQSSFQQVMSQTEYALCCCWWHYSWLTLILLTWRIWWAPNNASKWQMGFNSAFKGLIDWEVVHIHFVCYNSEQFIRPEMPWFLPDTSYIHAIISSASPRLGF